MAGWTSLEGGLAMVVRRGRLYRWLKRATFLLSDFDGEKGLVGGGSLEWIGSCFWACAVIDPFLWWCWFGCGLDVGGSC